MIYPEASYPFPDNPRPAHFHHIATWEEAARLARIDRICAKARVTVGMVP